VTVTQDKTDRYKQERATRLDSLLRRIEKHGFHALGDDEVAWLERASGELRFELGWDDQDPSHEES